MALGLGYKISEGETMHYFLAYFLIGLAITLYHTFLREEFMKELDEEGIFDHIFEPAIGLQIAARGLAILIIGSLFWPYWAALQLVYLFKGEKS